jgi:myosin heavy subunit
LILFVVFLKLDENGLCDGLLKRTIFAHGEAVVTPLNQEQAVDIRYES